MNRLGAYRNGGMQPPGSGSGGGLYGSNGMAFNASANAGANVGANVGVQATGVVILVALGLVLWAHLGLR